MLSSVLRILRLNYNITDLVFRVLFSTIFIGLGFEHIFSDQLIQNMMPEWVTLKRFFSLIAGCLLLVGGLSVMFGFRTRQGALLLGTFLVVVTIVIHVPAMVITPDDLTDDWHWLWNLYQRSNFVKNICLLGVCFHLINHRLGKFSIDVIRREKREKLLQNL